MEAISSCVDEDCPVDAIVVVSVLIHRYGVHLLSVN